MKKKRNVLLVFTAQLIFMTACGNEAVIDGDEGIPPMTTSAGFGYLETTGERRNSARYDGDGACYHIYR